MLPTIKLKNVKRANRRITNYRKRFILLKSKLPRLVIRFTNRQIIMQLVVYESYGDRILKTWLSSKQLTTVKKYNTSSTTLLALYKSVQAAIKEEHGSTYRFIIDSGLKNNSLKLTTLYDTFKN